MLKFSQIVLLNLVVISQELSVSQDIILIFLVNIMIEKVSVFVQMSMINLI
eukprot:jgi/Orpsp1_1/1184488/evm.model.c7180000089705.2